MNTCATCPRFFVAQDDTTVCPACARDIRQRLAELPHHARLLPYLLLPGASPRTGQLRASRAHPPLPANLTVLNLVGPGHAATPAEHADDQTGHVPLDAWLAGWAHYVAGQHRAVARDQHGTALITSCEQAWPAVRGIGGWIAWLTAYLPALLAEPADARAFTAQLQALTGTLRGLTGAGPVRRPVNRVCPDCDTLTVVQTHAGLECELCGTEITDGAPATLPTAA